ncbi:MAG: peptidase M28, partial [Flavobacteriaceae bacterium]|nr:peptidase M28 [Flavobacteriaceae bacterium]
MKTLYLFTFLFCATLGFAQTNASDPFAETIESEDLRQLLYVYASDFFQGRETGTLGQKRAVKFLKEFYETRGIK